MPARSPLESTIQRRIRTRLQREYPGSVWWKIHGGPFQHAGLPDLIGVVAGTFCGLEVKRAGQTATAIQSETLESIRRAGGCAAVVHDEDEALNAVRQALSSAAQGRRLGVQN